MQAVRRPPAMRLILLFHVNRVTLPNPREFSLPLGKADGFICVGANAMPTRVSSTYERGNEEAESSGGERWPADVQNFQALAIDARWQAG